MSKNEEFLDVSSYLWAGHRREFEEFLAALEESPDFDRHKASDYNRAVRAFVILMDEVR